MDLAKIRDLLRIVAESGVAEVEIEEDDFKLVIRRDSPSVTLQPPMPYLHPAYQPVYGSLPPPPAPLQQQGDAAAAPAPASSSQGGGYAPESTDAVPSKALSGTLVKAPIVGTFYRSASPDADPFVSIGDTVGEGDVLCIIEAMKLMNEIETEVAGIVREILVENAHPVEFDQPLFVIEPV